MLENVPDREEIRKMDRKQLNTLSADIRAFLIERISRKGGHLASNLGTVELTLALWRCFDFPKDKLIFDVGHQCYTWKLLTGRKEGFDHFREFGGMSGFPKTAESVYDTFNTGHSSTSLSAGIGLVRA
ncbi:MAG: 1-deoxy-D-xylulose-5-phosphate synthase, partial [Lachnospiraceae bacterium]|nr:1-deoxy-D-xylulose-5-phosphate synthase [Lachnospiraceae bacterium]